MPTAMKPHCGSTSSQGGVQWVLPAIVLALVLLVLGTLANFIQVLDYIDAFGKLVILLVTEILSDLGWTTAALQALFASADAVAAGFIAFAAVAGALGVVAV